MSAYVIPTPEELHREVLASRERCSRHGIGAVDADLRRPARLSRQELEERLEQHQDFLKVATSCIQDLYRSVAEVGFAATISDKDGYLLNVIANEPMLEELKAEGCSQGFRWTEEDVGTTAMSVALARRIPIQVSADEHFLAPGYRHTCSACPVFDEGDRMIGVIAMTGDVSKVHPHTLGMVITAARAIEAQLELIKRSKELMMRNNYMNAIIESIDSGVIAVDRNGLISQVNSKGKNILGRNESLEGHPISSIFGIQVNWKGILRKGSGYADREVFISGPGREIHLINTAKPIMDSNGNAQGIIIIFQEINRIRRLVNELAGSQARFTFDDIVGVSHCIQETKKLAMLAALSKSTVLLIGETGTGKELFAQSIHNESDRANSPFIAINCGAIPRELLESELFGYAEGAFTGAKRGGRPGKFELAHRGTILLDEIGDMRADMQVKLLRVLQTGEIFRIGEHKPIRADIRIIAATHVNLKQEVERGNFREDLFYRLNVLPIFIPPLRERGEDIDLLARHILNRCSGALEKPGVRFSQGAEHALARYPWPGNVRELENAVERAVNVVEGGVIEPLHLGLPAMRSGNVLVPSQPVGYLLEEIEKKTIAAAIQDAGFNLASASKALGITRATLYKKIQKYQLSVVR